MGEIQNKISPAITDKYEVSPALQPTTVQFGKKYGSVTIDLRNEEHLARVESFVKKYPDQGYFKLKQKPASAPVKTA